MDKAHSLYAGGPGSSNDISHLNTQELLGVIQLHALPMKEIVMCLGVA